MNALTVLLVTSLALAAYAFPQPDPQIVGGKDAAEGAYPFIVSLQVQGHHFCGGSIIHKRYIVTAAHCLFSFAPSKITVNVGTNYVDKPGAVYKVEEVIRHPGYNRMMKANDVGLIRLTKDIEFNEKVQPIQIANIYHVPAGQEVLAVGWGRLYAGGKSPKALQEVSLNVYDQAKCKRSFLVVQNTHICTYTKHGLGVCNGDSGGPLIANNELVGIVSFGRPCAIGHPDVYTRAYSFREWIKEHIVE